MNKSRSTSSLLKVVSLSVVLLAGCATMPEGAIKLEGKNEVPPVSTDAEGYALINVAADRTVSGTVTVKGMVPTAAHIHFGAPTLSGGVLIPLEKSGENTFKVPADTKLGDSAFGTYKAGNLYVNVHSAKHPGGEIRGQIPAPPAAEVKK